MQCAPSWHMTGTLIVRAAWSGTVPLCRDGHGEAVAQERGHAAHAARLLQGLGCTAAAARGASLTRTRGRVAGRLQPSQAPRGVPWLMCMHRTASVHGTVWYGNVRYAVRYGVPAWYIYCVVTASAGGLFQDDGRGGMRRRVLTEPHTGSSRHRTTHHAPRAPVPAGAVVSSVSLCSTASTRGGR